MRRRELAWRRAESIIVAQRRVAQERSTEPAWGHRTLANGRKVRPNHVPVRQASVPRAVHRYGVPVTAQQTSENVTRLGRDSGPARDLLRSKLYIPRWWFIQEIVLFRAI